jgi:GAF domain-containing protein
LKSQLISADLADKATIYGQILKQLHTLLEGESDEISCMANTVALVHQTFPFLWTGFYRVVGDELVLGPFQGPVACSRIAFGRGVCGTAWKNQTTILVPDVEAFPGHIVCNAASQSELVIPLKNSSGQVCAVLDIDSTTLNYFDEVDRVGLEAICLLVSRLIYP